MSTETSQPPPIAVSQVSAGANLFQTAFCSIETVRNGVASQLQSLLSIGAHLIAFQIGIEVEDFRGCSQLQLSFHTLISRILCLFLSLGILKALWQLKTDPFIKENAFIPIFCLTSTINYWPRYPPVLTLCWFLLLKGNSLWIL